MNVYIHSHKDKHAHAHTQIYRKFFAVNHSEIRTAVFIDYLETCPIYPDSAKLMNSLQINECKWWRHFLHLTYPVLYVLRQLHTGHHVTWSRQQAIHGGRYSTRADRVQTRVRLRAKIGRVRHLRIDRKWSPQLRSWSVGPRVLRIFVAIEIVLTETVRYKWFSENSNLTF